MRLERNRLHYSHLFLTLIAFSLTVQSVKGQTCRGVYVTNSDYQSTLNGYYYLVYDVLCNGQYIWAQQYNANYIQFLRNNAYTVNGNETSYASGWVIGPTFCRQVSTVLARQSPGYYAYPYYVQSGTWQEFDSSTQVYTNSTLQVTCSYYLTAGEIVGIVIGSVCCLVLFVALLACCCAKVMTPKAHRTQPRASASGTVVYTTAGSAYVYTNQPPPADGVPVYSTVIEPPPYDNLPPPAYAVVEPDKETTSGRENGTYTNQGFSGAGV